MFNNLIESSSHAREFKRRGSFLLFTTATYVVLLVITGVISIYAYDAHLETQNTELEITFVPVPPPEAPAEEVRNTIRSASNSARQPTQSTRTKLFDSVSNPNHAPGDISTLAQTVPEARGDSVLGPVNADPPSLAFGRRGVRGGTGNTPIVDIPDAAPPAPEPKPLIPKVLKISRVLNSQALELPKPNYPAMARQARVQGTVVVQVLIDEKGNVVSAKALSGDPLLVVAAQSAARRARFSPTIINDQPVKVSGVITYNFLLQ